MDASTRAGGSARARAGASDEAARLTDNGITNRFLKDVGGTLTLGTSALILLARSNPERRKQIVERLSVFRPRILDSDLPLEVELALGRVLQQGSGPT